MIEGCIWKGALAEVQLRLSGHADTTAASSDQFKPTHPGDPQVRDILVQKRDPKKKSEEDVAKIAAVAEQGSRPSPSSRWSRC